MPKKGRKRADRRFIDEEGNEWASEFESVVYGILRRKFGGRIRRCTERDTIDYHTPVRAGNCLACGSDRVVQARRYTPDLLLLSGDEHQPRNVYIEIKGYFPAGKRNLFRAVRNCHPSLDLRLIVYRDHPVTKGKTKLSDWAKRFKVPFAVWRGQYPFEEE